MIDHYNKSKKAFKKYIKENPYCSREEWDKYAHENGLFSAFTIECHEISDNTLKQLLKEKENVFEFLKETFIIIPPKEIRMFNKIIKMNRENKRKREEEY